MKVLWITPVMLHPVARVYNKEKTVLGGWVNALFELLGKEDGIDLGIICPAPIKDFTTREIDGVRFFLIPQSATTEIRKDIQSYMVEVQKEFKPDVVHVHGSEFPMGYNWILANGVKNVMISIQGLISVIAKYYLAGINDISSYNTLRDMIRRDSVTQQQKKFFERGKIERKLLSRVPYIAGRTYWDYSHTRALNPSSKYFKIGEILREGFRSGRKWRYEDCRRHSIFMSQGEYPVKGVHKVIEALEIVKRQYPDVTLRIAGNSPVDKSFIRLGGYGKYLKTLIKGKGLEDNIRFLGTLGEEEMVKEYLGANLFINASAIENSPNSLGEAMMLRMPVLSSYCGGTPDLLASSPESLYRFEEGEILACKIIEIFDKEGDVGIAGIEEELYDPRQNVERLLAAYSEINGKGKE